MFGGLPGLSWLEHSCVGEARTWNRQVTAQSGTHSEIGSDHCLMTDSRCQNLLERSENAPSAWWSRREQLHLASWVDKPSESSGRPAAGEAEEMPLGANASLPKGAMPSKTNAYP
jgi:hypothetical protein